MVVGLLSGWQSGLSFVIFTEPWFLFGLVLTWRVRSFGRPWRIMAVLDDWHRLGLLRTVGGRGISIPAR